MQTSTNTNRPPRSLSRYSPPEVFRICRRCVYPPCKKLSDTIGLHDKIAGELGYHGSSASLLALKTNQSFELNDESHISSLDIALMTTVQDHVLTICKKLHSAHRLVDDEYDSFGIT